MTVSNFMELADSSPQGSKTLRDWENCLLRAISPFPSVFKRLVLKTCKNHSLFWKELRLLVFHNKRAMMALDRSPESFSPQMNSTSLFQLVTPSFDPKGHHMNKIDKGLRGDATYQTSKLYPFQFQRRRILKLVFFVPMFQLVTPQGGVSFDPKGII